MAVTVLLSIAVCVLAEAVAVLAYTVYKIRKKLSETTSNLDRLANCVLQLVRHTSGVDIIEGIDTEDIKFPNSEGF